MIDHASIAVSDLPGAARFHESVLAPLGLVQLAERPGRVGFGKTYPEFWLNARPGMAPAAEGTGAHVAPPLPRGRRRLPRPRSRPRRPLRRPARRRRVTVTTSYAAFIRDAEGNRIEAFPFPHAGAPPAR